MIDLGPWLRESAMQTRQAGRWDCCTFPAAWVMANGLPDPMTEWRGGYDRDEEALALIETEGGLLALFDKALTALTRNTGDPQPGDIGLIAFHGLEAGAIFTGQRWAFVTDRGMAFATVAPDHIAAVWSLPHG